MPKFLINSGGDEFFMPDDNHYFWNDLPDDKYFRSAEFVWVHLISVADCDTIGMLINTWTALCP